MQTHMGTRPGDSFADVIFGYSWSLLLKKLERYMLQHDLVDPMPRHQGMPFFQTAPDQAENVPGADVQPYIHIGPTWMDDLALCVEGKSPQELESRVGQAASCLLDLCRQHLMSPNLAKGKTELLLVFRGRQSRAFKNKYYGVNCPGHFPVLTEHGLHRILITKSYKHLGGWLHHRPDQRMEVGQKAALAHATFSKHRKVLFANPYISFDKRAEIFTSIVLSNMLYGADSWNFDAKKDAQRFHVAVLKLYKRLIRWKPEDQISDEAVIAQTGLPAPQELLRRARLRYLATLCNCGIHDIWTLLAHDRDWCRQLEEDMVWMWEQLSRSSPLKDPREHFPQWLMFLQDHKSYWKRLINRACLHAILQRRKVTEVGALHHYLCGRIGEILQLQPAEVPYGHHTSTDASSTHYGCLTCGITCGSKAGEGAHMFRKHGVRAWCRQFFDEPSCPACLRFFHTMAKTKAHLYYAPRCRQILASRQLQCNHAAGTGSLEDHDRERQHNFLLPPSQGQGPRLPDPHLREHIMIDDVLYVKIVDFIDARRPIEQMKTALQEVFSEHPISWTMWKATLMFFKDTFEEGDALFFDYDLGEIRALIDSLSTPEVWYLRKGQESQTHHGHFSSIQECHEVCESMLQAADADVVEPVPPQFGKHRYVLHAYSGRRRVGDLQYFLECAITETHNYVLHVISLDIIVDRRWGDVSKASTREFWLRAIRSKWVIAFLGGPPCESWSRAREIDIKETESGEHGDACRGPRVLRDLSALWGFDCVSIRELQQLLTGNCLLGFSLAAMIELAATVGFGLLEHPAEPDDLPKAAAIWRLPLLKLMLRLPGMTKCRIAQGMLGAPTPKPTDLMALNLDDIMIQFHRHRIRKDLPRARAIGKNNQGHWRTSVLKEYPPSMCQAIACSFVRGFDFCPVDPDILPPKDFIDLCLPMECTEFGDKIGKDFAQ